MNYWIEETKILNQLISNRHLMDSVENFNHLKALKTFIEEVEKGLATEEDIKKAKSDLANVCFYVSHLERKQFERWQFAREEARKKIKNNLYLIKDLLNL